MPHQSNICWFLHILDWGYLVRLESAGVHTCLSSKFQHHIRDFHIPLIRVFCLVFNRHFENNVLLMVGNSFLTNLLHELTQARTKTVISNDTKSETVNLRKVHAVFDFVRAIETGVQEADT